MDEFARLMNMDGVRPLAQPKAPGRKAHNERSPAAAPAAPPPPAAAAAGHAWVEGPSARTALETALDRLAAEDREGRRGWATGIRQDGTTVMLPASSGAAALLGAADRQSLRLMVLGGDGWTFVMHPLMGVAALDEDPA